MSATQPEPPHTQPPRRQRWRACLLLLATLALTLISIYYLIGYTLCRSGSWNGPTSAHFDGERFFNPYPSVHYGEGSSLKWFMGAYPRGFYPTVTQNTRRPELAADVSGEQWECTMVNHSTMLIRIAGLNILTDPVWSDYSGPVQGIGPKRKRPAGIKWEDLPPIDICLISHSHYDHFDVPTLRRLNMRDQPLFIVPLGLKNLLEYHLGYTRVVEKDWWESFRYADMTITLTPAQHWSSRYSTSSSANRTLWCGFWLQSKEGPAVFYAGDTAWADHFAEIRHRLGKPHLALLPIGAYKPNWLRRSHINPADAVRAFQILEAQQAIACHFGTWQLGFEGYDETLIDLATALHAQGISAKRFVAPSNGQTIRGNMQPPIQHNDIPGEGQ